MRPSETVPTNPFAKLSLSTNTVCDRPSYRSTGWLRIRSRINETQVASVKSGQLALIRIDAFPDRPLRGTVRKITPIAELAGGPVSDVRPYAAMIRIDSDGFAGLRAGLSTQVDIQVATRHAVTRVPLEAIRWVGTQPFAAVTIPKRNESAWKWQRLALGASDTTFAEVVSGLQPGDSVISPCEDLPAPESAVASAQGSPLPAQGNLTTLPIATSSSIRVARATR
jgi:hypothetical protein